MTCSYEFDPGAYERREGEASPLDAVWTCDRPTDGDSDYCLFHRPPDETDPHAVADALAAAASDAEASTRFIGANLGSVALTFAVLRADDNQPIDLRHADVERLALTDATVHQPLLLDRATVGELDVSNTAFSGEVLCKDATVTEATMQGASFDRKVYFDGASFVAASFVDATFDDAVSFEGASVDDGRFATARFRAATFADAEFGSVSFKNARLERAVFTEASFVEAANFRRTSFGTVDFGWAEFHDTADFTETRYEHAADFPSTTFGDVTFASAEFSGDATFEASEADEADFSKVVFAREAVFDDAAVGTATFTAASVADCRFEGADVDTLAFEHADADAVTLSDATVDEATFAEARVADAVFDDVDAGDLSFARAEVDDISLAGAHVDGRLALTDALVRSGEFADAHVGKGAFTGVTLERQAVFDGATVAGTLDVTGAAVETSLRLRDATLGRFVGDRVTVRATTDLSETAVEGDASLAAAEFGGRATFDGLSVGGDLSVENALFRDAVTFREVTVGGDAGFESTMFLRYARFDGATVEGRASFRQARFDTTATFADGRFGEPPTFASADIAEGEFRGPVVDADRPVVGLGDCTLEAGRLTQPSGDERVVYDCEGATLGSVTVDADDGDAPALEHMRILRTTFDDFDFGQHKDALASSGWRLHTTVLPDDADRSHAQLEDTYRKAKNGAKDTSDREGVSELFIKELRYRGRKNRRVMADGEESLRSRATAANAWLGNFLLYRSCGYGERLWRVIAASVGVILAWALVFSMLPREAKRASGLTIEGLSEPAAVFTPAGIEVLGKNLYFSLVTFTTLGYGDVQPIGTVARVLAGIEAFLGAILIALVVFVLGRRVSQ
ncbi:pentapeptide repeat-containing protein [Halorarius halobius]|uniref:pentapeptide repeat-containing protein n=1 Tax=Halorarius halobius TaxID=2962671 RepID=UPI0020CCC1A1|nr:pentapeptide repeat-containing protein [Halorarius halobius]